MKMVPIDVNNIDFIRLDLSRHYIQIDCDFVCYIVLNPSGTIPVGGTDVCAFHVGAWQVDAWKFLTKDFAQIPGFSACLVWDKTLVSELYKAPQVAESDIDTANSISSLKGQPVNITGFSMGEGESLPVKTLDDVWVSVQPLKNPNDINVKPQVVSSAYRIISVGDVLLLDMIEENCLILDRSDTSIKFHPRGCTFHKGNTWVSWLDNIGSIRFNQSGSSIGGTSSGGCADCTVLLNYNDDIITSAKISGNVFGMTAFLAGGNYVLQGSNNPFNEDLTDGDKIELIF